MKRYVILTIAIFMMVCATSFAQDKVDSLHTQARIAELTVQRSQLKQRIAAEDKKRNSQIAGVVPEQMELVNLRQDSICLELRSQLTEVDLEISELRVSLPGTVGSVIPSTQGSASVQQLIQVLKRPVNIEEAESQKIE